MGAKWILVFDINNANTCAITLHLAYNFECKKYLFVFKTKYCFYKII